MNEWINEYMSYQNSNGCMDNLRQFFLSVLFVTVKYYTRKENKLYFYLIFYETEVRHLTSEDTAQSFKQIPRPFSSNGYFLMAKIPIDCGRSRASFIWHRLANKYADYNVIKSVFTLCVYHLRSDYENSEEHIYKVIRLNLYNGSTWNLKLE